MIFECVKMEHNSVSVLSSFGSHVIMGTRSFVDQLLSFDFNAENYSEETNAETNAGLVMRIYRIVPHIHSAVFSTLYYV